MEEHSDIETLVNEGYIYLRYPKSVKNRIYLYLINPQNGDKLNMSIQIESKDELQYFRKTLPRLMRKVSGISYYTGAKKRKREELHGDAIEQMWNEYFEDLMKVILKRDEFLNGIIEDLGFTTFLFLTPQLHLTPNMMRQIVEKPKAISPTLSEFLIELVKNYEDPERYYKIEKENEELKRELEELKEDIENERKLNGELRMQLTGVSAMLTNTQMKRFVEWLNLRQGAGWTEYPTSTSFIPIPYGPDDEFIENLVKGAVAIRMLSPSSAPPEGTYYTLTKIIDLTNNIFNLLLFHISENYSEIIELNKEVNKLKNDVMLLKLAPQQSKEEIVKIETSPEMSTEEKIKYLESQGYKITPPCNEDCVRRIVEESKSSAIDKEPITIIMDRLLELFDKWVAYKLYNDGKMKEDEFLKIMNFERYHTAKMPP